MDPLTPISEMQLFEFLREQRLIQMNQERIKKFLIQTAKLNIHSNTKETEYLCGLNNELIEVKAQLIKGMIPLLN